MTRIKICGLTRAEDLEAALDAGADAVGFNFVTGTPRALELGRARELSGLARGRALRVGVFRDAPRETIGKIAQSAELDAIQLHGSESPELALALELPVIKALPGGAGLAEHAARYPELELLIDHPSGRGGSGESWDFDGVRELVRAGRRIWLAGGLHPGNVARAIERVRPDGVDVASGVESAPGIKDPEAIRCFVARVRATLRDA